MKQHRIKNRIRRVYQRVMFIAVMMMIMVSPLSADQHKISLTFQETPLQEIMSMLSQQQRINILMAEGITANVSINLYDVSIDQAIRSIVDAAGFAVEYRNGNYYIMDHDNVGKYGLSGITELRTFKVQYSEPSEVESILREHLSNYGKITNLSKRKILVIEDLPSVLNRIEALLKEIDQEPKQILIEAKILKVKLQDNESFGLDWKHLFSNDTDSGSFGTQGLSTPGSAGFFFNFVNPNVELVLDALKTRGRLRTLSTPKLLAMEHQEAETQIGDNLGYKVTVTTNDVTTESIEFLESGIILRVTPSVDQQGRILLDIHPEVSTGSVDGQGVPSKSTTQVSTQMLVPDGQTVFIGGLIQQEINQTREGIPILGDLPGVGLLFSNNSLISANTETVVLITPKVVSTDVDNWQMNELEQTSRINTILEQELGKSETKTDEILDYGKKDKVADKKADVEIDNDAIAKKNNKAEINHNPFGDEYDFYQGADLSNEQSAPVKKTAPESRLVAEKSTHASKVAKVSTTTTAESTSTAASLTEVVQPEPVQTVAAVAEYGPVRKNDTLWGIADTHRPEGISVQQMMDAILAANPQAFTANNIQTLKVGNMLRIPAMVELGNSNLTANTHM